VISDHPFLSFPLKGKGREDTDLFTLQGKEFIDMGTCAASLPLQGEGREGVIKD